MTQVLALSGGVGGARFLDGLAQALPAANSSKAVVSTSFLGVPFVSVTR